MKAYFYGDLVQNKGLDKIAIQRKKKYVEIAVSKTEQAFYLEKGWELKKEFKNRVRLWKEKACDELLEDEVWLLFKNMGFIEMNKDRNFAIQAGPIRKQIDVFARDEKNVFIVECKAMAEEGPRSLRQDIHEILNLKKDIIESIRKNYGEDFRFSFLLVTKNIKWSSEDKKFAGASRGKNFFFWREAELAAYTSLTNQLGTSAKFQMYSILFFGKKIPELGDIEVPAIYGGKGKNKYYSFIIQPEKLLCLAYVHRREESNPEEVSGTYQRMLKNVRLNKICKFINKGGFFPNNIVLNFTEEPIFEKKDKVGDIAFGVLKFPKYYGSAWIIDGQHRLYGYSETERRATAMLPVVAFVKLKRVKQAKLFVEINKEQKPVSPNLLWDLYPDIYQDVEEEKYQTLRAISLIVKKLNSDLDSPLHKHIYIPSIPKETKGVTNLTIANICDGLKDNKLINEEEGLLYEKDYEHTVDFAGERIKTYFDVITKSFPQDWKKGDKGVLRTNIGIRIFLILLRQHLRYLKYKGSKKIYRKKDLGEFKNEIEEIFDPVLTKLKKMSDEERSKIRGETGKGRVMNNAQQMAWWIKEKIDEFGLEILRNWAPPKPKEVGDEDIRALLEDTEPVLRGLIIKTLKEKYGPRWWRGGIPRGVKNRIKEKIESQIHAEKWRKEELEALDPERRFKGFIDTPHLRETIKFTPNWKFFENIFVKDKEYTLAQFKSFEFIRHKYQHFAEHECDEISKNLGYWGMKWIRRCIGLDKAEKKP